jgi:hypothetical protein
MFVSSYITENLRTEGNNCTYSFRDKDNDRDDLLSLAELFGISKRPRECSSNYDFTKRAYHKASEEHFALIPPNGQEIIDLTADNHFCAVCFHGVHQSNGNAARVFIFKVCGCVYTHLPGTGDYSTR